MDGTAASGLLRARRGTLIRKPSAWKNLLGGGTRCPTSPTNPATRLADPFTSGSRGPGAQTDAYFDPVGQGPAGAGLLLAAALADLPITQVHTWLTDPTDDAAVPILMDHGFTQTGKAVNLPRPLPQRSADALTG
ncbi:hypothetical protein RKD54_004501 [Pseudarthrobacter sp. SLBN-100]|uniref:hypothetical protein n=1 Tax=Arthrobacter sp. SLBN-100 TaxID=2768450 RepID=UPI001F1A3028|nr:hypothetical protein [Arthrobacter sp. SLBN-100]